MTPSSIRESTDAPPARDRSIVGLMVAIAVSVLGIVFIIALVDMSGDRPAPLPRAPAQDPQGSAKAAPPL